MIALKPAFLVVASLLLGSVVVDSSAAQTRMRRPGSPSRSGSQEESKKESQPKDTRGFASMSDRPLAGFGGVENVPPPPALRRPPTFERRGRGLSSFSDRALTSFGGIPLSAQGDRPLASLGALPPDGESSNAIVTIGRQEAVTNAKAGEAAGSLQRSTGVFDPGGSSVALVLKGSPSSRAALKVSSRLQQRLRDSETPLREERGRLLRSLACDAMERRHFADALHLFQAAGEDHDSGWQKCLCHLSLQQVAAARQELSVAGPANQKSDEGGEQVKRRLRAWRAEWLECRDRILPALDLSGEEATAPLREFVDLLDGRSDLPVVSLDARPASVGSE